VSRPVTLALRALGLGDFLAGLPALQLLKRALPDAELVLAAPPVFAPLIPLVPAIDRLAPTGELMPLASEFAKVDVAVDLHGNGPASRHLLSDLSPHRLVGFANAPAGLTGPVWFAGEHEVHRWCRLVSESFDVGPAPWPGVADTVGVPQLDMPAGLTIVHPGAAAVSRRWPSERFAEVALALRTRGHRVVITGGAAEHDLAESIAERSGGTTTLLDLSLTELFAVVAGARLVVSGDTGVAHVASNYRTPSVVLFGPVSPAAWGPPQDPRHVVLFHGDGRGDPHGTTTDPSLLKITVPEVLDGVDRLAALTPR
jgi:ADP-heptose:LPS heptosyltransferase